MGEHLKKQYEERKIAFELAKKHGFIKQNKQKRKGEKCQADMK